MRVSRKNKDKKTSYLMPSVFLCTAIFVILLSIGYSIITDTLTINGKGVIRAKLDIRITNIELAGTTNGGLINSNPEFYATSLTTSRVLWDVTLPQAESTVTYNVTVTNLSDMNAVVTSINTLNDSNSNIEYILNNMAVNTVKMPKSDNYQFQITVKYKDSVKPNISSINRNETANIEFTFYKLPVYTYQITTNQQDAEIKVKINNNDTQTYQGSYNASLDEGTNISFEIQKHGYQTITLNETVTTDIAHNYTMTELNKYTMTFTTNPTNAILNVTYGDRQIASTSSGSVTFEAYGGYTYNYVATGFEYYDSTGTYTMPASNSSYNITLTEWPGFSDQKTNTSFDLAANGTITVTRTGYYLVELWGGIGGRDYQEKSSRSNPGYIYATVKLYANQQVYYSLGGNGEDGKPLKAAQGGANGGADAPAIYPGGGGGYSAIAINTQTINETNINNGNVLMIAGGGGGSGSGYLPSSKPSYGPGGNGGTLSSTSTTNSIGYVYYGTNGSGADSRTGAGGTTTGGAGAANKNNKYAESGSILKGGKANTNGSWTNGGSGGAGYYGGGGGAGEGRPSDGAGSGGGGSSLISTVLGLCTPGNTYNASLLGTNPSSTGGAVKITFVHR